ncbi:nuclear transport factor 2 family protein [Frankia sp. Mgl5]|uniref:nuclear transport factor 2 family protein n=1 Tax=Frankia sp. Mgl5 TaxID=2933793 RepID=UPI00200F442D|nr:nuclear transport factor 2 family protein [Frankia sp. Mgl5]MCK9931551.1 nuclear transport factor 2 family protein [Frankia sp. Mgl5]
MTARPSPADLAEITQTLALFAHVVDNRQTDDLGLVFTEDASVSFERSGTLLRGFDEIAAFLLRLPPDAADHQTVNTAVLIDEDGTARALSRYISVGADGAVTNGDYEDVLVRADDGWRIRSRRIVARYPRVAADPAPRRDPAWPPSVVRLS